ncbi:MAG: phosphatidylglycerophosphatase A [Planctomycetota bacterium]|nr:MAG: phosphatidylglycerophosphatase A [Planctomycetota bacterium]
MDRLKEAIATFFYAGYVPRAPGTAGAALAALICLPVFLFIPPPWQYAAIGMPALLALLGNAFSAGWAQARFGKADPPQMVVDEALGMFVTVLFAPAVHPAVVLVGGFVLFRIFDIAKPFPVRQAERLPGWVGIAVDDLAAGVLANLVLHTGFICYNAVIAVG